MKLTDRQIQKAKPSAKRYHLADGDGLGLIVHPNGSRYWQYRYSDGGKRKEISLGSYPDVSLGEARARRDEARRDRAHDIDPKEKKAAKKKSARAKASGAGTFEALSREYLERQKADNLAEHTLYKTERFLFHFAKPILKKPIRDVTAADILSILKGIEADGQVHTAHRVRGKIGEVFRYAVATLRADMDPTYALRGAIRSEKKTHRAAITEPRPFGKMLNQIDEYTGWHTVRAGLQLLALCYPRPVELRLAEWDHIDFDDAVWHLPAHVTKMRREHDMPLSRQAIAILKELREGDYSDRLVFPQMNFRRDTQISENGMNNALRRMGITKDEHCGHGFRASASTMLNKHGFDERVIEASLAHLDDNEVRRTYNRYRYWDQRVKLAQAWADLSDDMRQGAKVKRRTPEIA